MDYPKAIILAKKIHDDKWYGWIQGKSYKIVNQDAVPAPTKLHNLQTYTGEYEINNKEMLLL